MYSFLCNNKVVVGRRSSSFCNLLTLIQFSSKTSSAIQNPSPPKKPLIVDHLVESFGFSRDRAIKASKRISLSASLSSLSIVSDFFKQSLCFTDAQVTSIISRYPQLLSSNVEETLKPKLKCLEHLGFSGSSITNLISGNPSILRSGIDNTIIPTIEFLRSLQHSDQHIIKALRKCNWLLTSEYRTNVSCNIDILRQCGVPDQQITRFLIRNPRFFAQEQKWFKGIVARVDELGVKHDSGLFIQAFEVIGSVRKATIETKFELYKSCGWSKLETVSAFRKFPKLFSISEQNINTKMSFLIEEVGYKSKDIAVRPILLGCSLEKVLKPRNAVLNILISRGLIKKKPSFNSVAVMSKEKFLQNCVVKYANKAPDLQQVYSSFQC